MLTAREFSIKIGADKSTILRWINEGRIPGAKLVKLSNGRKSCYMIPDDAVRPESKYYRGGQTAVQVNQFKPDTSKIVDKEHREQLEFVAKHLGWSVKSIAHNLGVSTNRVRELFDDLLRLGGAEDEFKAII